jgi:hypothetical protein
MFTPGLKQGPKKREHFNLPFRGNPEPIFLGHFKSLHLRFGNSILVTFLIPETKPRSPAKSYGEF